MPYKRYYKCSIRELEKNRGEKTKTYTQTETPSRSQ